MYTNGMIVTGDPARHLLRAKYCFKYFTYYQPSLKTTLWSVCTIILQAKENFKKLKFYNGGATI